MLTHSTGILVSLISSACTLGILSLPVVLQQCTYVLTLQTCEHCSRSHLNHVLSQHR